VSGRDPTRFESDWLALREPADHAARSERLAAALAAWLGRRDAVDIVDLGAGAGSNTRWLAPWLDVDQRWLLLDHDRELLARAARLDGEILRNGRRLRVETRPANLRELRPGLFSERDVVTASALFDLVSAAWVVELAECLSAGHLAGLFALTVDGRRGFLKATGEPSFDEMDEQAALLFARHQASDKGFGEALGPEAARVLPRALSQAGMRLETASSDWLVAPGDSGSLPLAEALMRDWRTGLAESPTGAPDWLDDWYERRLAGLRAGRIGLFVGHVDVLALPGDRG
jgi:trans-aconitate methyltransferase